MKKKTDSRSSRVIEPTIDPVLEWRLLQGQAHKLPALFERYGLKCPEGMPTACVKLMFAMAQELGLPEFKADGKPGTEADIAEKVMLVSTVTRIMQQHKQSASGEESITWAITELVKEPARRAAAYRNFPDRWVGQKVKSVRQAYDRAKADPATVGVGVHWQGADGSEHIAMRVPAGGKITGLG
ncbi:hypothetical protein V3589_03145 [Sinorhizobium fredii]|uniref:hypothetical protein n=1 Tax=Rhizobium fredii TaxID=380 RepID=UPI0030B1412D